MTELVSRSKTSTKNLLSSIVDSAISGIMTFKSVRDERNEIQDFEWIFANKVAADIVGREVDELLGSKMLKILPGNLKTGLFEKYKKVVETGETISFEQYYNEDNLDKWFQISACKIGDGFTVTFQDISPYKNALAELETKGLRYQKLFEESIDPIFLLDDQQRFLSANSSFQKLFGYSEHKLKGTSIEKIFYSKIDYLSFYNVLDGKNKIEELEVFLITHKSSKRYCLINAVPVYDEENKQVNYIGVIRDMTKRRQAEEEILIAEKLSMTGKIARTIGHEIRNPLTNLSLAVEQLKEDLPDISDDTALYLNIIERNANRIGTLITDLLNSSKPKELNLVKQPLRNLITEALSLVKDRLHLQKMTFSEHYPEEVIEIPLDSDQLKIALLNLFINAIEAMEPGKGKLNIEVKKDDELLKLMVRDNGKGISAADRKKLFEPFFSAKQEGSGLGLTTVQNIVHSHKGKIEVESTLNQGTTFTIKFAIADVE